MKQTFILISFFLSLNLFGQKSDIENLINQIAQFEVPENFKYYFLVPKSLEQEKIKDSLQNYQIWKLNKVDMDFSENFIYTEPEKDNVNWRDYDLDRVNYVSDENNYYQTFFPPKTKKIRFVKYNIDQKKYDSLVQNKEPYTLILRKKWFWNKKNIWNNKKFYDDFVNNWEMDDQNNPEETVYFHFSKPKFSENKKYAIVTVKILRRCNGHGFTALYRNDNGIWKNVIEFNQVRYRTVTTHTSCEDIKMIE